MISRQSKTRSHRASSAVTKSFASRQSLDELYYEEGKRLRDKCPCQSHGVWQTPTSRPDPVLLLEQSSKGRIPQSAGPTGRQVGASTHVQPTPRSIGDAEAKLGEASAETVAAVRQAMLRARVADSTGDKNACEQALTEAQGAIGP